MAGADLISLCCGPIGLLALFFGLPFLASMVRIVMQYENGILFRLGRLEAVRKPGVNFIIPFLDRMQTIDMRIRYIDIPKQEALTKDNISVFLNAVVYYQIADAKAAILKVQDYKNAIFQLGQAAMRDITGSVELNTLLSDREKVAISIQQVVERETQEWGVRIISINIQDIELPGNMKKAMARQAQAERDKRATVNVSMGEVQAAGVMAKAANIISSTPGALHLRTLQALSNLSADKTNTITYLLPIEGQELPGNDDAPGPKVIVGKKK